MKYDKILEGYFETRNKLFDLKQRQIEELSKVINIEENSVKYANKDFRTLHMEFGRRTGATYWLVRKFVELNDKFDCKIIVINYDMKCNLREQIMDYMKDGRTSYISRVLDNHIITGNQRDRHRGMDGDYLFLDCSFYYSCELIDQLMMQRWKMICFL